MQKTNLFGLCYCEKMTKFIEELRVKNQEWAMNINH